MNKIVIDYNEMINLFNQGKSFREISDKLNVSPNTIKRRLSEVNLSTNYFKKFDRTELYEMYIVRKMTTQEIGEYFGVSKQCINKHLRKHNIELRNSGHQIKSDGSERALYSTYKYNAKIRDYEFNLQFNKFKILIKQNCHYCGKPPNSHYINKCYNLIYNGLDRIDNTLGYSDNNVVTCCSICNKMKLNMSHGEFIEHIKNIYNYYVCKFD